MTPSLASVDRETSIKKSRIENSISVTANHPNCQLGSVNTLSRSFEKSSKVRKTLIFFFSIKAFCQLKQRETTTLSVILAEYCQAKNLEIARVKIRKVIGLQQKGSIS